MRIAAKILRAGGGNRTRMTSLEVLSSRTCAGLLKRTRRSKLFLYPGLSLRPRRCLPHLARHWPATRRDLLLRSSFRGQCSPAALVVRTDLLGTWLRLGIPGFRPVLVRGWHEDSSPVLGISWLCLWACALILYAARDLLIRRTGRSGLCPGSVGARQAGPCRDLPGLRAAMMLSAGQTGGTGREW